jgi:lycopene cyclase domain-containing protein
MEYAYLVGLIVSITGLALLDYRFKLAFWHNKMQTIYTLLVAIGVFIAWDICGIILGIFKHGSSAFNLPFTIAPEFPIEELFFLTLLCYTALMLYRGIGLWRSRI